MQTRFKCIVLFMKVFSYQGYKLIITNWICLDLDITKDAYYNKVLDVD